MAAVEQPASSMNGDIKFTIVPDVNSDVTFEPATLQDEVIVYDFADLIYQHTRRKCSSDPVFPCLSRISRKAFLRWYEKNACLDVWGWGTMPCNQTGLRMLSFVDKVLGRMHLEAYLCCARCRLVLGECVWVNCC